MSSSLKNKDIEIDSLSNQIKNNNEFSENLKNAVNTITGDIFEKKTKDFKEQKGRYMIYFDKIKIEKHREHQNKYTHVSIKK